MNNRSKRALQDSKRLPQYQRNDNAERQKRYRERYVMVPKMTEEEFLIQISEETQCNGQTLRILNRDRAVTFARTLGILKESHA